MHELLARQALLHDEATQLLESTVLPILNQYGMVEVGGSYLYQLLYAPDLDIGVISSDVSKQIYIDVCTAFMALTTVSSLKSTDRVHYAHRHWSGRPTGYWISPRVHHNEREWELDIWLQQPEWYAPNEPYYQNALQDLSETQRLNILALKRDLIAANQYGVGKAFQSVDIYRTIIADPNQSWKQLQEHFGLA